MPNPTGGITRTIEAALTVNTGAYSANDNVGGIIELPNFFNMPGGSGVLQSLFMSDRSDQDAVLELLFFDELPTDTYTNNAAMPTLSNTDFEKLVARVSVAAADWGTQGGVAMATVSNLGRALKAPKGTTSLWMVIAVTSTPTYGATTDLRLMLGVLQD